MADFESADLSQREFAQERGLSLSNIAMIYVRQLGRERRVGCGDASVPLSLPVSEGPIFTVLSRNLGGKQGEDQE